MTTRDEDSTELDVAVIGCGLSGMSAAVEAATSGARTVAIERAPMIGGSAALSGGYVWSMRTLDDLRTEDPGEFQKHGHVVVEGYADAIAWLSQFAPPISGVVTALSGRGQRFEMPFIIAQLHRRLVSLGGRLFRSTEVVAASRDASGFTLQLSTDGHAHAVRVGSLVLASGGRQADPAVRADLVGGPFVPPLRGNAYSSGGGAAVAVSLGASVNTANHGFYGHLYPAGVEAVCPADFMALALYHSGSGVLLGPDGRRFTREARGDHVNAMALAEVGGRGLLLWSQAVQNELIATTYVPGVPDVDRFAFARDRGAQTAVVPSLNALAATAPDWGFPRVDLDDEGTGLLAGGDIFALPVVPAVTFTFGGIEVDAEGNAVTADGDPIAGLFAAGADMSDAYHRGYGGGLSLATVTGRRAGRNAAEASRARRIGAA